MTGSTLQPILWTSYSCLTEWVKWNLMSGFCLLQGIWKFLLIYNLKALSSSPGHLGADWNGLWTWLLSLNCFGLKRDWQCRAESLYLRKDSLTSRPMPRTEQDAACVRIRNGCKRCNACVMKWLAEVSLCLSDSLYPLANRISLNLIRFF